MTDIREVIARAICKANGHIPDVVIYRNPEPVFCWQRYTLDATRVMEALDKAGMVVVPKEPTEAMRMAGWNQAHIVQSLPSTVGVTPIYRAMLAATPTLPILHGNGVEDDTAALQAMIEGKPYVDETK